MAVRWGDHKDVPQGRAWRGRLESKRRRNAPGEARWIGICGCPCGRGKETHGKGREGRWERQDRRKRQQEGGRKESRDMGTSGEGIKDMGKPVCGTERDDGGCKACA